MCEKNIQNVYGQTGMNPNACSSPPKPKAHVRPWKPSPFYSDRAGPTRDLRSVLAQLAGAASTCWVGGTGDREFESELASDFVEQAHELISDIIKAHLDGTADALGLNE
jgi:hypothetical protein